MPLSLPPLNGLRAFEAAARNGSYVAAAEELDVSPAAISQQVRHLEDFLGRKLFKRFNNRVVLTDAGQAVFAGSTGALQSISSLTEQVMSGESKSRLIISVLPSIAHRWLEPQLSGLLLSEPRLRVDVRVEDDSVDFARHNIDLRMCYGSNLYPDMTTVLLNFDEVLPLCRPTYLSRNPKAIGGMTHVPDDDLIHTNWGAELRLTSHLAILVCCGGHEPSGGEQGLQGGLVIASTRPCTRWHRRGSGPENDGQ